MSKDRVNRLQSLRPRASGIYAIIVLVAFGSCIKELPIQQTDTALLYVNGAVLVDSSMQELSLGITDGIRVRGQSVTSAIVEVRDLTSGEVYDYRHTGEGRYEAFYRAAFDHAYQLRIEIPETGVFLSRPDSLALANFSLSAEAGLQRRINRDGEAVARNFVTADLSIANRAGLVSAGILTARPFVVWSYEDQVCGPFDIPQTCYLVERPRFTPFAAFDLSTLSADGDTAVLSIGAEPLDYRWAGDAFLAADTRRYSPAATAYFTAISQALNPTGSPLDERPLPAVGNVRAEDGGRGMLGFFGVAEARILYASSARSRQLRGRRTPGPCAGARDVPASIDCCFCNVTPGALTRRPSYLP